MRDKALARLKRLVEHEARGAEAEASVIVGDPAEAIGRRAGESGAGLLVLGIHRPRPLLDMFRDSTMQRIVRLTRCPVLLARDTADHPYETVVAALDFSPAATNAILTAPRVAPGARIFPIHALQVPYAGMTGIHPDPTMEIKRSFRKEAEEQVAAWASKTPLPDNMLPVEIVEGSLGMVIQHAIERHQADLLCIGAHARSGLAATVLGDMAAEMIHHPPCDLLVTRG